MQVQEWPQPNSCLEEEFVGYSIDFDLQKKMFERKSTKEKHNNPGEKIYFKNYNA